MIETNRASKQTSTPNTLSLPAATEPVQGSVQINKQTTDNKVLPEATTDVDALMIPDKTDGNTPDGPDKTITQLKNVLPDTTNLLSPDTTKDNTVNPNIVWTSLPLEIQSMKSLSKACSKERPLPSEDRKTHILLSVVYALPEPRP